MLDHYVALKARPGQEQALSAMLDRFVSAITGQLTALNFRELWWPLGGLTG